MTQQLLKGGTIILLIVCKVVNIYTHKQSLIARYLLVYRIVKNILMAKPASQILQCFTAWLPTCMHAGHATLHTIILTCCTVKVIWKMKGCHKCRNHVLHHNLCTKNDHYIYMGTIRACNAITGNVLLLCW